MYGTQALTYVTTHHGDHGDSMTSPGMLMIQNADYAAEKWHEMGMPRGHITRHSMWSVSRAAVAALTWSLIELGIAETVSRLTMISKISDGTL